jgi:hypothetical protein
MATDEEKKARKWLDEQDIFPYDFGDYMPPDNEDFYQEEDVYKAMALARQDERQLIYGWLMRLGHTKLAAELKKG